jgi:hypothetical protein
MSQIWINYKAICNFRGLSYSDGFLTSSKMKTIKPEYVEHACKRLNVTNERLSSPKDFDKMKKEDLINWLLCEGKYELS